MFSSSDNEDKKVFGQFCQLGSLYPLRIFNLGSSLVDFDQEEEL